MKRRFLTAVCAVLVIWGGAFYGLTQADDDLEVDW